MIGGRVTFAVVVVEIGKGLKGERDVRFLVDFKDEGLTSERPDKLPFPLIDR
jgi:hypothetical protein